MTAQITIADARALLGVTADADEAVLRRAFHAAVMAAHPDRPGGGVEAFSRVMDAYGRLKNAGGEATPGPLSEPLSSPAPDAGTLTITPELAMRGGSVEHTLADGRTVAILLPAGLRAGDAFRTADAGFRIAIRGDGLTQVRGDDIWTTARAPPHGGRLGVAAPGGEQVVWVTARALQQGLLRVEGQGLPARGAHRRGSLYIRLTAEAPPETPTRDRIRRFAATWAA